MRLNRRTTRSLSIVLTPLVLFAAFMVGQAPNQATASSHREAPLTAADPYVDNTDTYAFVSPDRPNPNRPETVTLLANFIPFQFPEGGPNWYSFDGDAIYSLNVDNIGDAKSHIRYEFDFDAPTIRNPDTFLYNTGPITGLNDVDLNVRQTYDVYRVTQYGDAAPRRTMIGNDLPVPPPNIGPKSTPNYPALANAAIRRIDTGGRINVFAGPRDDSFFVDLGSVFDLLTLRPQAPPVGYESGSTRTGIDGLAGYNVHTIALQVPIEDLRAPNTTIDPIIGVWSTTSRPKTRVLNTIADVYFNGAEDEGLNFESGDQVQVSRLGMPLVNEAVIPLKLKNAFNTLTPEQDFAVFSRADDRIPEDVSESLRTAVLNPELQRLLKGLYGVPNPTADAPMQPRNDILSIFLTGIKLTRPFTIQTANGPVELPAGFNVNQPTDVRPAEMLRLNTAIRGDLCKPDPDYQLGLLGGDACGFPNGRRIQDDVTDIELLAVAGAAYNITTTGGEFAFDNALVGVLRDGVNANDKRFLNTFPYAAAPHQGADHTHVSQFHVWLMTVSNLGTSGGELRRGGIQDN